MIAPKISVIIPVFNTAAYVGSCLDSILNQTFSNIEVICVNDGSTDGSLSILESYAAKDYRIKVLTQKNQGQGEARNNGFKVATGEWITYVDSDDYIALDTYEKVCEGMQEDVDIIWYDLIGFTSKGEKDHPYFHSKYVGKQKVTKQLILDTNLYPVNKLWRKSFLDKHKAWFPAGLIYEDAYFYFTIAPYARNFYFVPKRMYFYRQREGSTMNTFSPRGAEHLSIAELILRNFKENGLPPIFGKQRPAGFERFIFVRYTQHSLNSTPKHMHRNIINRAYKIGKQYGIIDAYPIETAFIRPRSFFSELFYIRTDKKLEYRFFGIPIFSLVTKNGKQITRLFSIKIRKKQLL